MRAKDIIHLIERNIEIVRTSENRADMLITLLEDNTPRFSVGRAICGSSDDFFESLSSMEDITSSVISGIRGYVDGTKKSCVPTNLLSISDAEEINAVLEYVYGILDE